MNAIVEIDKSGRIVVPKKLRDELHLIPGTRLQNKLLVRALYSQPGPRYQVQFIPQFLWHHNPA